MYHLALRPGSVSDPLSYNSIDTKFIAIANLLPPKEHFPQHQAVLLMSKLSNLVFSGGCFILIWYNCGRSCSQALNSTSLPMVSDQHAIYTICGSGEKRSRKVLIVPQCASHSVKSCQLKSLLLIMKKINRCRSPLVLFNAKASNFLWKALFSYW